jgi:hypothetical protein
VGVPAAVPVERADVGELRDAARAGGRQHDVDEAHRRVGSAALATSDSGRKQSSDAAPVGEVEDVHGTTAAHPGLAASLRVFGSKGSAVISGDELVFFHGHAGAAPEIRVQAGPPRTRSPPPPGDAVRSGPRLAVNPIAYWLSGDVADRTTRTLGPACAEAAGACSRRSSRRTGRGPATSGSSWTGCCAAMREEGVTAALLGAHWGASHGLLAEDFHRHARSGQRFWIGRARRAGEPARHPGGVRDVPVPNRSPVR